MTPHTGRDRLTTTRRDEPADRPPSASEAPPPSRSTNITDDTAATRPLRTRRRVLASVAASASVGLAGCGSALDAGSTETTVQVRLAGAPAGIRKYQCRVEQDGEAPITSIEPMLIDGDEFQVINGGVDSASVGVRAADISESVTAFEDTRVAFALTVDGDVTEDGISMTVPTATDDAGDPIPDDQWQLTVVDEA